MKVLQYTLASIWLVIILVYWSPSQAQVERDCDNREIVVKQLETKWNEIKTVSLLKKNGTLIEIFVAKDKSTWTMLLSQANGITCYVDSGFNVIVKEIKEPSY